MEYLEALAPQASSYFRLWRNGRVKNVPARDYEIGKRTLQRGRYESRTYKSGHDSVCGLFETEF